MKKLIFGFMLICSVNVALASSWPANCPSGMTIENDSNAVIRDSNNDSSYDCTQVVLCNNSAVDGCLLGERGLNHTDANTPSRGTYRIPTTGNNIENEVCWAK
ncbi:MAG: hypothetical protein FWG80_03955 [Alphaproteobacteria bacterium]|nr:hypothetical protein [Alphaproteobacteria bacterium]